MDDRIHDGHTRWARLAGDVVELGIETDCCDQTVVARIPHHEWQDILTEQDGYVIDRPVKVGAGRWAFRLEITEFFVVNPLDERRN